MLSQIEIAATEKKGETGRGQDIASHEPKTVLKPSGCFGWHCITWSAIIASDCDAEWLPRIRLKSGSGTAVQTFEANARSGTVFVFIEDTIEVSGYAEVAVSFGSLPTRLNIYHWRVSSVGDWKAKYTSVRIPTPAVDLRPIPEMATSVSILSDGDVRATPIRFVEHVNKSSPSVCGNTLVIEGEPIVLSGAGNFYSITGAGGNVRVVFNLSR